MADWHLAKEACAECGRPREQCSDPKRDWYPQRSVCYVTMNTVAADRLYDSLHEDRPYHDGTFRNWVEKRSPFFPYHARDGVRIWVAEADLNPDDKFLNDEIQTGGESVGSAP